MSSYVTITAISSLMHFLETNAFIRKQITHIQKKIEFERKE
jgi:hypothetical protein